MKTTNIILAISAALILSGCMNLYPGKKGNGNVVTEDRNVSENFTEVKASAGMDVFLTEGSENKIVVEADENLLSMIKTEVRDGKLEITSTGNIGFYKSKKVHVTYVELNNIEASSGSEIVGNSVIRSERLSLKSNSGAEIKVEVFSKELTAKASSGADIEVSGKASSFIAEASSGSELDAKKLLTINCTAKASSGADISVTVKERLETQVSSGGDISYYGNPVSVDSNKSSSGSVRKK